MIRENHSLVFKTGNQWMKVGIIDVGGGAIPANHQTEVIQKETELATDDPTVVRNTLFADLLRRTTFTNWVDQFDPITIDHTQQTRFDQEGVRPSLMGGKQTKQTSALSQR